MAYTDIDKPSDYFNTVTYVANQTDDRQITVGFQPDFTWLKDRDQAVNHDLYDAVRGATKYLSSNKTNAEGTQTDGLKSFNSTGFTLGTGWGNQTTGDDYVSWNWLASNTTASNTDGSITSTVSANTTSGFSIVKYTGTGTNPEQVGHGLGVAPKVIFLKALGGAENWFVDISALTGTTNHFLHLNLTNAAFTTTSGTQNIGSSTFDITSGGHINSNGFDYIAYCFAEKKGFSKAFSYTGNGSSDGSYIHLGFRPAFVIVKRTDAIQSWYILDNKRNTFNPEDKYFKADASSAEDTLSFFDFLSNGFKARGTGIGFNASGGSYIGIAFAENPFVTSTGIPTTAR